MNFKTPEEALNRSIDTNQPAGGLENKLTPEQMKDLVRNLDVTKIQNFEFKNSLADLAPEAKMILGDKNDLKEALLALSDVPLSMPPMTKEVAMSFKWLGSRATILNNPDWEKIEKNGAVFFPTYFKTYSFYDKEDKFVQELYKDFAENSSPELLVDLYDKYKSSRTRGAVLDPEVEEHLKTREEAGLTLDEDNASAGYLFPFEKQVLTGDQSVDRKYQNEEEYFPTLTFNYKGHEFRIIRNPQDNTADKSLQDQDNPFMLKRFGSWFNLFIDGVQYKEKTYDPNTTNLEGTGGIYDGFNSWRKWIGYRDVVVQDTK